MRELRIPISVTGGVGCDRRVLHCLCLVVGGVRNWWLWQEGRVEDQNREQIVFRDQFQPICMFTVNDRECVTPVPSFLTSIHEAFQAATSELSKLKAIWEFLGGKRGEGIQ